MFTGSTNGLCTPNPNALYTRYFGYYLGQSVFGTGHQPVCGDNHFVMQIQIFFLNYQFNYHIKI